jgi:hypothetical protein
MAMSGRSWPPVPSIIAAPEYTTILSFVGSCGEGEGAAAEEFAIIDGGTPKNAAGERTTNAVTRAESRFM